MLALLTKSVPSSRYSSLASLARPTTVPSRPVLSVRVSKWAWNLNRNLDSTRYRPVLLRPPTATTPTLGTRKNGISLVRLARLPHPRSDVFEKPRREDPPIKRHSNSIRQAAWRRFGRPRTPARLSLMPSRVVKAMPPQGPGSPCVSMATGIWMSRRSHSLTSLQHSRAKLSLWGACCRSNPPRQNTAIPCPPFLSGQWQILSMPLSSVCRW